MNVLGSILLTITILSIGVSVAQAGVVIGGTRVIFDGNKVERIVATGALPQDKESLFWLNIKAIPSAAKVDNTLQIAIKTRIKLIYRPAAMKGASPEEQVDKLRWQRVGNKIQVNNPTQHVMNFNEISLSGKKLPDVSYVLPGSTAMFDLPSGVTGGPVTFKIINDYGSPGAEHKASL
ncbi:fimbria/pilus periplasmic chaperone [Klebsiella quasipneumoniae]|uniref:fimbria/pilus periplasmic chaperone n=1 Tax=Klebsiella quasipneumoniae TaxID=1463165 RepID=UPI00256EDF1B|nr:fimbria/pilus periplasmic chaperone [Klebsiella quasipneumoniae]MDL5480147.1 fimbria/pilus periplasmic chaperone [Klebsiella quasipneumoniae]